MTTSTERQTFRETVALVAETAKAKLPQAVNGRIESAARLVVNGDVEPLDDGSVKVGGSDPTRWYHLVGSACTCTDFTQGKAPDGWCKHRIAAGIHRRVGALLPEAPAVIPARNQNLPLPEAPVSITLKASLHGYEALVTLRGTDFTSVQAQVEQAAQWLQSQAPVLPTAPQCPIHRLPMKINQGKDGRTWLSHKTADGWCKGK